MGQEVTARMKHKTEQRKGLAKVQISAPVDAGTEISANGKPAGTVFTQAGTEALAYLRYDRATAWLLYTFDAADDLRGGDIGGRRSTNKKHT